MKSDTKRPPFKMDIKTLQKITAQRKLKIKFPTVIPPVETF